MSRYRWYPRLERMRRELLSWVDEHAGEGLKAQVLEAIVASRETLRPG